MDTENVDNVKRSVPPIPSYVNQLSLSAATAASTTIPAGVDVVRIHYTAGVAYGKLNGTAVVPVATVTDGTGSFMVTQGDVFSVRTGDMLSLINASACLVTFSYWDAFP
jgi:hypothetical protein